MTPAQRAVIAAAKKDGLPAMEISAEFICHSLMEVLLAQLRKREVAFNKLGEREQDSAIQEMQSQVRDIALSAARVITANGCETVAATMKSLKIDSKLIATMTIDGDEPNRHILTDKAHDKSGILIVLYPHTFNEGMSEFQGERDQKPLPLENEQPAADKPKPSGKGKPVAGKDLANSTAPAKPGKAPTEAEIKAAEKFAENFQNVTTAGLQNQLKIGLDKAEALLEILEQKGIATAKDASGQRQYIQPKKEEPAAEPTAEKDDRPVTTEIDADLYEDIKAKVIADQRITLGFLQSEFKLDKPAANQALAMLEADEIVGPENDLGGRAVLISAEE